MAPAPPRPAGLHPFVAPVAGGGPAEGGAVVGLLAWPRAGPSPVVRAAPGARGLEFLARSPEEYVVRALAEEDLASGPGPVATAVAAAGGGSLYKAGSAAASPMPNQNAYLTKEVGIFPDTVAGLVEGHLGLGGRRVVREESFRWLRPAVGLCGGHPGRPGAPGGGPRVLPAGAAAPLVDAGGPRGRAGGRRAGGPRGRAHGDHRGG